MNNTHDIYGIVDFFANIGDHEGLADDIAKKLDMELPDVLKGCTVKRAERSHHKGQYSVSISTLGWSWLVSLFATFLAKTKCYLVCVEIGDRTHCVHVCVTCFDSWPGPGCYIHGSWD